MPQCDVNGASIYYETDGAPSARPLLLLPAGVANLRMWDPQVDALAREHFVVRFDPRGFGLTETQNVGFSNRADALAVLDHAGVHKAAIVGASRGGTIALDLALESPGRVLGLCVVDSGPSGFPDLELTDREDELFDDLDTAHEAKDWQRLLRLEAELWGFGPLRNRADLDPAFVQLAHELNLANLAHVEESPVPLPLEPPAYDRLTDIGVPTLIVVGEHDISEALAQFQFLRTTIPQAESYRFADAAHLPSVECPDEFEHVLLEWLDKHGL